MQPLQIDWFAENNITQGIAIENMADAPPWSAMRVRRASSMCVSCLGSLLAINGSRTH
jgi:hypothetical protein